MGAGLQASSPATFRHRYAPSPAAVPTHDLDSPQFTGLAWTSCLCATVSPLVSGPHTKSGWTLVLLQVEPLNEIKRMLALAANVLTATASSVVRR
ncbi:hypothetical protein ACLK1S_10425 [Escherichia coli]